MEVIALRELVEFNIGAPILFTDTYVKTSGFPVTKANGSATTSPVQTDLIVEQLPSGTGLVITDFLPDHVDDVGGDFLQWQVIVNGAPLPPYEALGGSIGRIKQFIEVNAIVPLSGKFSLSVLNFSGTDPNNTNYPARQDVRVAAVVKGYKFKYLPRRGFR